MKRNRAVAVLAVVAVAALLLLATPSAPVQHAQQAGEARLLQRGSRSVTRAVGTARVQGPSSNDWREAGGDEPDDDDLDIRDLGTEADDDDDREQGGHGGADRHGDLEGVPDLDLAPGAHSTSDEGEEYDDDDDEGLDPMAARRAHEAILDRSRQPTEAGVASEAQPLQGADLLAKLQARRVTTRAVRLDASRPDARSRSPSRRWSWPVGQNQSIFAIGDLHGSPSALREALKLTGVVCNNDFAAMQWCGNNSIVVQTGDLLDRGRHDKKLMDMLDKLTANAAAVAARQQPGGALYAGVLQLVGNHEMMNLRGDFQSSSNESEAKYREAENRGDAGGLATVQRHSSIAPEVARSNRNHLLRLSKLGFPARARALLPGGPYAMRISQKRVVVKLGDTIFVHAGLGLGDIKAGLGQINAAVSAWAAGKVFWRGYGPLQGIPLNAVWSRRYGEPAMSATLCRKIGNVLTAAQATRIVVGHTIQDKHVTSACDGAVWRIDIGMFMRAWLNQGAEVLHVRGSTVSVLSSVTAR